MLSSKYATKQGRFPAAYGPCNGARDLGSALRRRLDLLNEVARFGAHRTQLEDVKAEPRRCSHDPVVENGQRNLY